MPLPKTGTPEWKGLVSQFQGSTLLERRNMAQSLGYENANTLNVLMNQRGVYHTEKSKPTKIKIGKAQDTDQPVNMVLPEIELKTYTPWKTTKSSDPETAVLHLTDHHNGEVTVSYNGEVYRMRLDNLFRGVIRIVKLHRNMYPVNDLVILLTGDMVHGENVHQGAKVGSVEMGARDQVASSLHRLAEFILSLKQEFVTVEIHCVRGNHGRYSREAPTTSNWDMMLYDQLKIKLEHYGINVYISDSFYKMVDIQGNRFFVFHGDQFRATQGVPWFAMTKGLQSWYVTYNGFFYAVCGHFHKDDFLRINSKCKLIMGASMVTDDTFVEEVIKTSSIPCQWFWGVHKQKGVTWNYSLITDSKYFNGGTNNGVSL